MASRLQRFSTAQVCQSITGDDWEVDYIFPGSDDELDALELHEIDEDQAGTDDDFDNLERIDQSVKRYFSELVAHFYETELAAYFILDRDESIYKLINNTTYFGCAETRKIYLCTISISSSTL